MAKSNVLVKVAVTGICSTCTHAVSTGASETCCARDAFGRMDWEERCSQRW